MKCTPCMYVDPGRSRPRIKHAKSVLSILSLQASHSPPRCGRHKHGSMSTWYEPRGCKFITYRCYGCITWAGRAPKPYMFLAPELAVSIRTVLESISCSTGMSVAALMGSSVKTTTHAPPPFQMMRIEAWWKHVPGSLSHGTDLLHPSTENRVHRNRDHGTTNLGGRGLDISAHITRN